MDNKQLLELFIKFIESNIDFEIEFYLYCQSLGLNDVEIKNNLELFKLLK